MFNTVDFSGDNKISKDEYLAAMGEVPPAEHKYVTLCYHLLTTHLFTYLTTECSLSVTSARRPCTAMTRPNEQTN